MFLYHANENRLWELPYGSGLRTRLATNVLSHYLIFCNFRLNSSVAHPVV